MTKKNHPDTITIRPVHPERLATDMGVNIMLTAFYAIEMSAALGWSVEERYMQIRRAKVMIEHRRSGMLIAYNPEKQPCGMVITTKTAKPKIRRLEAVFVADAYRQRGIASKLFNEAGAGNFDWHSFAVPHAVDWHLKRGFRNLGIRPADGTIEMFTGRYKPVYDFDFALPLQTAEDRQAMRKLQLLEDTSKRESPGSSLPMHR